MPLSVVNAIVLINDSLRKFNAKMGTWDCGKEYWRTRLHMLA